MLTHFSSVPSSSDSKFGASVYILCIHILLNASERRFKDSEHVKFTVSFITNPFQEMDTCKCAELLSPVFKENVSEVEAKTCIQAYH
jgi:hypothetical protein